MPPVPAPVLPGPAGDPGPSRTVGPAAEPENRSVFSDFGADLAGGSESRPGEPQSDGPEPRSDSESSAAPDPNCCGHPSQLTAVLRGRIVAFGTRGAVHEYLFCYLARGTSDQYTELQV